jgi:hypothetical protein
MASPDPRAIIMAGFDYQGGGVDFGQFALRRRKMLIAASPRLSVTIMNVGAGTRTVSAMTPNAKGVPVRTETTTSTHSTVTAANYSTGLRHHTHFDTDQAGRMSITDLYAAVQDIGSDPDTAGSLTEVSVFSHGFFGGPILVNSVDSNPRGAARDPEDMDARASKDFRPPNMMAAEAASFKAAFAATGLWWSWGCAFTSSYRQVTAQFIGSPLYRKTPPGKLKDTDKITFEFRQDMADAFYRHDTTFFPQETRRDRAGATLMKTLKFERTVRQIKDFFLRGVSRCYGNAVAKAAGVRARGACLGTYSDYEKGVKAPLMIIPQSVRLYGTDFSRYIAMWVKVLGFSTDPDGRGYCIYPP